MDVEDDEIVEEIPVYFSKTLADNLFILQYPVKASNATFDDGQVVNSCVKPINQQIKVDYALNTASKNYDSFKGEQFAIAADGKEKDRQQKPTFRSGTMDKQSFLSSKPIEDVNRYMICAMQDREIHATPLKGIVSMRQVFSYFDKQDKRTKAEQKAEQDADGDEEELKQVTVKFARTENEKVRKAREKSFNYISKMESEEPWCETFWHRKDSSSAELERQRLYATTSSGSGSNPAENEALNAVTADEYLAMLISKEKSDRNIDSMLPSRVVCMHKLRQMTLVDQIKIILKDAKVLTFQQIMELLPNRTLAAEKVLRTLPLAGVLIRGNWVVQSEIIYPEGSVSGTNGVPAEQMCKARDYILYRFTQSEKLERHQLASITQLPTEEIREILCSVARLNDDRSWSLLLPPNEDFSGSTGEQEISDRQNAFWTARAEKFNEMEKSSTSKRVRKKSARSDSKYDVKMSNG
ncbi:DNA-directed RNA polymerase III subunit RPC5 [Uranotaenia lowii]|uniref:DNA-directed RNA polymerase III subunit RPC5 n=1 Tax=Uranotaenia lowii TaxID=190385 RepID=UPI0024797D94|nr:DNA-directed RNA polymerase III subunit RPC5 [Uranotaenia lowii]